MKILLTGSFSFLDKFTEIATELNKLGHEAVFTEYTVNFIHLPQDEIDSTKMSFNKDFYKDFWITAQNNVDAILILNYEKRGIKNYIGGSTLIELAYAHILGLKKYLLNPIPTEVSYFDEINSFNPIILDGDLSKLESTN